MPHPDTPWPVASLEQLTAEGESITYGVVKPGDEDPAGVAFIRGGDIVNGRILTNQLRTITPAISEQYRRTLLRGGELLVSLVGNPGQVALVPPTMAGANIARQVGLVRLSESIDPLFAMYFLSSPMGQAALGAQSLGSVQQVINLRDLKRVELPLPPLDEQRAIASVLGSLDDKIEQNRRTGRALEGLARAVFKAWFVDFEPVRAKAAGAAAFPGMPAAAFAALPNRLVDSELGAVPEGWNIVRLDDVLTLQRGFDLPKQSRTDGPHPIFAASGVNGFHSEWKVKGPGVTTGRSGVLGQVFYVDRDFWPLNTSLWVKEYPRSNPWHAYFLLQTLDLAQFNAGSAVPTLNRNHVHSLRIVASPDYLLAAFAEICRSTFALDNHLREESEKLAALRDYLLPRLLSGKVRVREAERAAAGVGV